MGEFNKPKSVEEFHENFSQIKPLMDANMAYYESSRCLFCYDAPCIKACPTGIDIPLFIKQIHTENVNGAARTIYASNYFGNICGKVCPTEVLCEGACVYNHQNVKPIEIGRLQSFATTRAMENNLSLLNIEGDNGKRVAIIGAGPAGISCACELRLHGYQVDIFEARSLPSGLALHGTAPYKIRNEDVLDEVNYLQSEFGFSVQYDTAVFDKEDFEKIEKEYDAIYLGIGLGDTRDAGIENENLENCMGATEFIEELKMNPVDVVVGKKVVVIGGGNTAMDAASESARMGAEEVTLVYRRAKDKMSAYEFELDLAKFVGVKAIFNTKVSEVHGEGKVESVTCQKTEQIDGKLMAIEGSDFKIACDMLIKATGQTKQTDLLETIGLKYVPKGRIQVNPDTFQCSKEQYFAGGDAVNGGAEVVNACAEGKKAGQGIHAYLSAE